MANQTLPRMAAGQRYGRLIAIERVALDAGKATWLFQCDCGNEHIARATHVRGERITSCGCAHNRTHGMCYEPEYIAWHNMIQRCTNPKHPRFYCYGARGIKVCKRWFKFENFLRDVGRRPSPGLSIDRIDNDDDYKPGNVHWATFAEQLSTRRPRGPNRRSRAI